jgi:signal transduction histidine kinase
MKSAFRILLVLLPLLLGSLASFLLQQLLHPVPVLLFRLDVSLLLFFLGVFISLILASVALGYNQSQRQARRQMEQNQRDSEESHRRFIRRLDHEIKNPLTGLQAALVNLKEASNPEDRQRAGQNAHNAVERLGRLLTDLRKLSELDERQLERMPVDVPELLEEMVNAACALPAYARRSVNLVISRVPWPLPSVIGDRDLLGLAFYNLIDNALKFSVASDTIEVRALEDGRALVVEVADSGPGIPVDESARIFEELYRGSNAHGVEGSGLGLALVRRIIALHAGEISLRSRQAGSRGTIFTIRLPITNLPQPVTRL